MIYYVLVNDSTGEIGGVFNKRIKAINTVRNYNAIDYDSPMGGEGGWRTFEVDAPEGTSDQQIKRIAKAKQKVTKMENKVINRLLDSEPINEIQSIEVTNIVPQIVTKVKLSQQDQEMFQDEITKAVFEVARRLGIEMYRIFWQDVTKPPIETFRGKNYKGV